MGTGSTLLAVFFIALAAFVTSYELRRSRNRRMSLKILAEASCPECDGIVGPDTARVALGSFRLDKHISIGNFGLCAVNCPNCDHEFYYHIDNCRIELPPHQWQAERGAP